MQASTLYPYKVRTLLSPIKTVGYSHIPDAAVQLARYYMVAQSKPGKFEAAWVWSVVAIPSESPHAHPKAVVVDGDHTKFATSGAELGRSRPQCMGVWGGVGVSGLNEAGSTGALE